MKVALIHDFLREYGGAERVLESLHQLYPNAPVYVAFLDKKALGTHWNRFADWDIRETWFGRIPFYKKIYSPIRFLAPHAFASLDLSAYDLVISSSNAFMAKGVKASNGTHICYCHTPPRALYGYSTMSDWKKNWFIKICGQIINHYMRRIDFKLAQRVDCFIANSEETQRRIEKFYRRNSCVIYPPVNVKTSVNKIKLGKDRSYYFYVGRLGLQKHPELAVEVANKLGFKLKIAGVGQLLSTLKNMAADNIEFLGAVSDEKLRELYGGAKALLYPVEDEDFGIIPIEAMAAGTPVIAHRSGEPMETIRQGKTGLFIDEFTSEALEKAVKDSQKKDWDYQAIAKSVQQYSQENFRKNLSNFINKVTK